jgi:hypothetical protein
MTTIPNLDIRGILTECTATTPQTCETVVYQATAPGLGNISNGGRFDRQRRRWVIPHDPRTPAQLARRARFASGVAAWQAMDTTARQAWHWLGEQRRISSFNAFLSNHLRT